MNELLHKTTTANGAVAYTSTLDAVLDFYSTAGSVKTEEDLKVGLDKFLQALI
jgi:hypothetical protein